MVPEIGLIKKAIRLVEVIRLLQRKRKAAVKRFVKMVKRRGTVNFVFSNKKYVVKRTRNTCALVKGFGTIFFVLAAPGIYSRGYGSLSVNGASHVYPAA